MIAISGRRVILIEVTPEPLSNIDQVLNAIFEHRLSTLVAMGS